MPDTNLIEKGMTTFQGAPIRVTVSAAVAFNPQSLKNSIAGLMEKLGCGKCFSGFDCRFQLQRDYLIDPEMRTQALNNDYSPSVPAVNVRINKATSHDLEKVIGLVEKLHGRFGCLPCHSGFDFRFRNEIRELAIGN